MKMKLKILQFLHLIIFLAGITIVVILHIKTTNFWDFLRLPKLIVDLDPFFGSGWPASLHVYQAILVFAMIVALINGLGTFFYRRKIWRMFGLTLFIAALDLVTWFVDEKSFIKRTRMH